MASLNISVDIDDNAAISAIESTTFTITNDDAIPVAAKVASRNKSWYIITPPRVMIAPRSTATVEVLMRPPAAATPVTPSPDIIDAPPGAGEYAMPLSDQLKIDVRALVSLGADDVESARAQFDRYWDNAVPQSSHTVVVRLTWLTSDRYFTHLYDRYRAQANTARTKLQALETQLRDEQARVERLHQRNEGYAQDNLAVKRRVEAHGAIVSVHWAVALVAVGAGFVAAASPEVAHSLGTVAWLSAQELARPWIS